MISHNTAVLQLPCMMNLHTCALYRIDIGETAWESFSRRY